MEKRISREERHAERALNEYVARRIANMSPADWRNTPRERHMEFLKAARRAVAGIMKFEADNVKRGERMQGSEAKRQERRELSLEARRAKAEGKSQEK